MLRVHFVFQDLPERSRPFYLVWPQCWLPASSDLCHSSRGKLWVSLIEKMEWGKKLKGGGGLEGHSVWEKRLLHTWMTQVVTGLTLRDVSVPTSTSEEDAEMSSEDGDLPEHTGHSRISFIRYIFLSFYFEITILYTKVAKIVQEFLYPLYLTSSNVNILQNLSAIMKTRKLPLI